jgi:hypothetical protein
MGRTPERLPCPARTSGRSSHINRTLERWSRIAKSPDRWSHIGRAQQVIIIVADGAEEWDRESHNIKESAG